MKTLEAFNKRRSYYVMDDNIKVSEEEIEDFVKEAVRLVPDAMGNNTQQVILVFGDAHKRLRDNIYDIYEGAVAREKINGFKAGYGTVLFFYNDEIVEQNKREFPFIEQNFEPWANQANGMLQITIWNGLTEMGLGVNVQHYNPVIDKMVREMFDIDPNYKLLAQMVFGNPLEEPEAKVKSAEGRFRVVR